MFNNSSYKNKNNYPTAYNVQQKLPEVETLQEGQEEITFLIDSGANINIVRESNLFVSMSSTNTRLKSLGKIHYVDLGGIVEVYVRIPENNAILLRFDAIYIPPKGEERTHIL